MRRTIRESLVALCAAALLVLVGFMPTASSAEQRLDVDTLNQSVVWVDTSYDVTVEVPYQDGTTELFETTVTGYCTGWFVSPDGHVATAGHCVEFDQQLAVQAYQQVLNENGFDSTGLDIPTLEWPYSSSDPYVYVAQPSGIEGGPLSGEDGMLAQLIDYQGFEDGDNALLRIANMTDTPYLPIASGQPQVGDEVTSIGFAGSVARVTDESRQPPSFKSGQVSSLSTSTRGVPVTEIDAAVSGGMSGGPTVNGSGEVVGINSFGIHGESQSFNFVTDTETMRVFLTSNGVEVSGGEVVGGEVTSPAGVAPPAAPVAPVTAERDSSSATGLLFGLGGVILVLVVALGFLVLRGRKSPQAAGPVTSPPPPPSQDERVG